MNKQEKLISLLLGLALVWCLYSGMGAKESAPRKAPKSDAATAQTAKGAKGADGAASKAATHNSDGAASAQTATSATAAKAPVELHDVFVSISNDQEVVTFAANELGVGIDRVELLGYPCRNAPISDDNPPVSFDFGRGRRALAIGGAALPAPGAAAEFAADTPTSVVYRAAGVVRRFTLLGDYRIGVEDEFAAPAPSAKNTLSLGAVSLGESPNDLELSIDSMLHDNGKGKGKIVHHGDDEGPLQGYLAKSAAGGCGCGCGGARVKDGPAVASIPVAGRRDWVAVKNRFFVVALSGCDQPNDGFTAEIERDPANKADYRPKTAGANLDFASVPEKRSYVYYAGPKKQSLLWDAGMKDVMEFGMWRWICYPMVWLLAAFYAVIPNYGVAIILLTILVRLVFWPLTRKSTEGMKKMQEIQPLLKELQAKHKDNPQRLQQETWALYREKKVNPLSSCLPMFIQIPVFIALFNVLRSAVELRYAGFLWISDLSEPEHLFASWFPFGGLNILPILMAATMFLQSKLTPSAGDQAQQRMMTVFMPLMMLAMFYNFASALSLYWTVSQLLSILQMWLIRRSAASGASGAALTPEVIPPVAPTRQMRRHG